MFETPHRLHPAAIVIKFGTYFAYSVRTLAVPFGGIFLAEKKSFEQMAALLIAGFVALTGALSLVGTILHFLSTNFFIEGDSLVINSGFVWKKRRVIPLARIQNVNVERTLWHRLLGAAEVKVETAAGHKSEGELTALSEKDATKLQMILLQNRGALPVEEAVEKPAPIYQLSPKQVLLAGALGNRAMYILASMMAVFQFDGARRYFQPISHFMNQLGPVMAAAFGAAVFFGLILVGWLVSIGISATRFYGFRIERHERGLLLSHGLITQFRSVVPLGRIQDVRIVEPILYRWLGYCEIYADTAGSFDAKDVASANKICPILRSDETNKIGQLLLPEFEFERLYWNQVSKRTVFLHASRYFRAMVVILSLPLGFWLHWNALWLMPGIVGFCWISAFIRYRVVGYAWTDDILVARTGVLRKSAIVIPFDRIQQYSIYSSWFQRLRGLATLTASSAATGGHAIAIVDLEIEAAEKLRKTIGISIHNHLGSRRSGL
ncbi:MAG: PH domain-containing protein [Armatimonadota bacterium]